MKHYIAIGIAIVCGILAFALQHAHMARVEQELGLKADTLDVVAARGPIFAGDELTEQNIQRRTIMKVDRTGEEVLWPQDDASQVRPLMKQRVTVDVPKGAPILRTYLDLSTRRGSIFADIIPESMRAVTIGVDSISGVANLIRPSDRVDVLGTFRFPSTTPDAPYEMVTMTIMQNVSVLAVDKSFHGSNAGLTRSYTNVSLAVSPEDAEFIVFAQEKGKLTLTLRNSEDGTSQTAFRSVNFQVLEKALNATNLGAAPTTPRDRR